MAGPENGNFPLLYVMEMSLRRGWVVLKSLKTPLRNIKTAPTAEVDKRFSSLKIQIRLHFDGKKALAFKLFE